jgi:rhodanese-related sulfurtransferase
MPTSYGYFVLATIVLVVSSVAVAEEHTKDKLATVMENVAAKKAVIVDVREKEEWDSGHLEGASLVPLSTLREPKGLETSLKRLPKDRILYTHCAVGVRSLKAAEILKKHGYDVRALKAGYAELLNAGFPNATDK